MTNLSLKEDHKYSFKTDIFGKPIKVEGKKHYEKLMAQGGYVPFEVAQEIAKEAQKDRKEYKASPLLINFLRHLYSKKTKDGKISLGGKEIEVMKRLGVRFDDYLPDYLKKNKDLEGGFC